MNLETLFDDLEAKFELIQNKSAAITLRTIPGLSKVTFARGHYFGLVSGSATLRIVQYKGVVGTISGESAISEVSFKQTIKRLTNHWVSISTGGETIVGRINSISKGLVLVADQLIPLSSIESIEVKAVDNQSAVGE